MKTRDNPETGQDESRGTVLAVDDKPANLRLVATVLGTAGYRVLTFADGELALRAAKSEQPDLALLDIAMPGMDGYEVCERLKADSATQHIPVIFLTALGDTTDKVKGFNLGGVDYVHKPFVARELIARIDTHITLRRLQARLESDKTQLTEVVQSQVEELAEAQMATIFALARLAESRDATLGWHVERVQLQCRILGDHLLGTESGAQIVDKEFVNMVVQACPLHDIGKVGIADRILLKPGRLTDDEFEIMKSHSTLGWETLDAVLQRFPSSGFLHMGATIARSHHERWDGEGYPEGLAGDAIPLEARIMAVADVYDAIRSRRCYKEPQPHLVAVESILDGAGTWFDPVVVEAFERVSGRLDDVLSAEAS